MTLNAELHFYVGQYVQRVHTGSGVHTASCCVGTGTFLQRVKRPEREADHFPLLTAIIKNERSYVCVYMCVFVFVCVLSLPPAFMECSVP